MTNKKIQKISELETWHKTSDPWEYEKNPEDLKRKAILLSEIPAREYERTLDIGCGQGFLTRFLPGKKIVGMDISANAIGHARQYENDHLAFRQGSLFDLNQDDWGAFDLIVITGILYPQYIGNSSSLIYHIIDRVLQPNGILVCVHIDSWYNSRFSYPILKSLVYDYREYIHRLEIYEK